MQRCKIKRFTYGLQLLLKIFEGFVYLWSQTINFVNEQMNLLKVFITVKDTSGVMFSMN